MELGVMAEQAVSRRVYVGGVVPELLAYRQRAEAVLRRRGSEPVFTDRHNPRDQQALKTLRKKIAGCDAVICLVGFEFGDEPTQGVRHLPRRSFAQWEYALAQELNKPVYRLMSRSELPPAPPSGEAPNTTPRALGDSATQTSPSETFDAATSAPVTSAAGDSRRGPPRAGESAEQRRLQQAFRDDEQYDETLWKFDGPGDFERRLAVLRFPWEPGVGNEKLVALPYESLGECLVGRAEPLAELDTHRQGPPDAQGRRVVALVTYATCPTQGAGVGKTRLAVEYAERHLADFSAVAWVPGQTRLSLEAGLARLADHPDLGLSAELVEPTEEDRITAVLDWFETHRGWLLIVDGVDTPEARDGGLEILKNLTGGMLLLTGRIDKYPPWVSLVPVDSWADDDGVEYLLRATDQRRWRKADEQTAARELVELLHGLPLALEWAAAVVRQNRLSFAEYLARWHETAEWVAQQPERERSEEPDWVVTTWRTTYQQLSAPAQLLLESLAWYAPAPLCRAWFEGTTAFIHFMGLLDWLEQAGITPRTGGPYGARAFQSNRIVERLLELHDYRMLDCGAHTEWLLVSRLTQSVTQDWLPDDRLYPVIMHLLEFVRALLDSADEPPTVMTPPEGDWLALAPHVEMVALAGINLGIAMPTSQLLNDLAEKLDEWGHVDSAIETLRQGIALQAEEEPHETAILGKLLFNLGRLVREEGAADEAEPLLQRALAIAERWLGPNDPDLVPYLCRLIDCLQDLDRGREAEPLLRRVLVIEERRRGPEHYTVQVHRGNLAVLLMELDLLDEAESLLRKTMKCLEKTVGVQDPGYLRCLTDLVQISQKRGNHAETEKVLRQSLELAEARFGKEDYEVVWRLAALGVCLLNRGAAAEAEPWLRRAAASELTLSPDKASVVPRVFQLLGQCLGRQGKTREGEPWLRKALALCEAQLGPDHLQVGDLLGQLAAVLDANNQPDEAWELCGRRLRNCLLDTGRQLRPHGGLGGALNQYEELGRKRGLTGAELVRRLQALLQETRCPPQLLRELADSQLAEVLGPLGPPDGWHP
jgi:tetratricopeptide (TPR) repeat protein